MRQPSRTQLLLRAGRLPHAASAIAFISPAGKSRPNWEQELHGLVTPGALVTGSHEVRSHSTAVPGGGDGHPPKGSPDEPAVGLDGHLRLVSTQSKPLQSQNQLGSYAICKSAALGNQEIISKRLILLLLFQLQRGE